MPISQLKVHQTEDGIGDAYDLATKLTEIGAVDTVLILNSGTYTVSAALSGAANVTLYLKTGAQVVCNDDVTFAGPVVVEGGSVPAFSIAVGKVLTLNGSLEAGLYQVFSGAGTVVFGQGAVEEVYPEWWGVDGTADEVQINAALNSLPAGPTTPNATVDYTDGGTVKLSRRNWITAAPIVMDSFQKLVGSGPSTVIKNSAIGTAAITMGADDNAYHIRMGVENLTLQGPGGAYNSGGYGIHGYAVMRSLIKKVWIGDSTDSGIYFQGSSYTYIDNCDISANRGYGVHLKGVQGDAYLWTTSTHISNSTIQVNYKAGVYVDKGTKGSIHHSTIESNCFDAAVQIGLAGSLSPTSYFVNVLLHQAHSYNVHHNYFENSGGYGTAATRVCVANSGSQKTRITFNDFVTDVGLLIWASAAQAPWFNYIVNNEFQKTLAGNMVLAYAVGQTAAYNNTFIDNKGMRVADQDSQPYKQDWFQSGVGDGLRYRNEPFTHTNVAVQYAPDLNLRDADHQLSGQPNARIHIITLKDDISVIPPIPTGIGDFMLTFIFIQDGVGGHDVTFAGSYKDEWSNVGNVAGKRSSIIFYGDSTSVMYQLGAQSGYY